MAFAEEFSNVQVLYQLSWEGRLEHPHMITVQYPSNQGGLRLKDVKKRLTTLRGQGIGRSFSWSFKRNYRNTFIWNDLSDEDVIYPLRGSGEYLLKAFELIDTFANIKPEPESKLQHELKQISAADRHSRTMSAGNLAVGNSSEKQGVVVAMDILQSLQPLSMEQETIDMEKSDFCLSSSDNEVSPRRLKLSNSSSSSSNPANNHGLVVMTKSPTGHGPLPCRPSPTEAPFSPGSAKRLWKREIKKSLFRTRNTSASSSPSKKPEIVCTETATLQEEALTLVQRSQEDPYLWKDSRSKSVNTLELKEKEAEQSTSQLIRLLWARWTGGSSSKGKRISTSTSEESPCKAAKTPESTPNLLSRTKSKEEERLPTPEEIFGELALSPVTLKAPETSEVEKEIAVVETPTQESCQSKELRMNQSAPIVPEFQAVLVADTQEGGPPEAEIETPKPAIARVDFKRTDTGKALPKVRTTATSPKPLPPGFHKGTNDTKQIHTPRRSSRNNSIPLASPPLRRSLSRDAARSLSAIGAITETLEMDSATFTPSPKKSIKKCIDFHERDERPLIPGLTTSDWEKALQAAVADCLPPSNFGQILQECATCGRTFKPDSLQVHRRGCHPPQYTRAFSARASPHMIRSHVL